MHQNPLDDHIRALLQEIAEALIKASTKPMVKLAVDGGAKGHGADRLRQGFSLTEVVAEYNALREVIQEFGDANRISFSGQVNAIVNRVMDKAVAMAVQAYSDQKALEIQQAREEHLSFLVHDLKTPLAAISMAANILDQALSYGCRNEPVGRMLGIVHRNGVRLNSLISRVLQESANLLAARVEAGFPRTIEKRDFDLWPVVEDLIHDLQPIAETKDTQIKNEVSHDCILLADPTLMVQVLQNLLSNALDYTTKGEIVVGAVTEGDGVHCWVRDSGEGIPSERMDKIFDKLESDPRKKGSLGLSLAVVKQIVEAHGGQITVASKIGQGSIFDFYLPRNLDMEKAS